MSNQLQQLFAKKQIWFVVLLLVIAAFFRAYHLLQIPLMNDELSALYRLQFNSFSSLIHQGVIPDGHPAFVQVFLFYYTKFFGISAWVIKLPFIIAGVISIGLMWYYFSNHINKTTGSLVALFALPSQFFIMHSQTARPYAFGLLFVFAAAIAWEKCVKHFSVWRFLCVVLFSVLSASTHYLAALTLIVVVLFSCITNPKNWKFAWILAATSVIVYLPQTAIFIKQLQVGGVGTWLGKPSLSFIIDFWLYASNFSSVVAVILSLGGLLSVYFLWQGKGNKQIGAVGLIWMVVFGVEFLYSLLRNPILQFPSLLFVWPFCLAFCFWGFSQLHVKYSWGIGLMLFSLQTHALIFTRKHYQVFYNQSYSAAVLAITKYSTSGTPLFLNGNQQFYFDYYFNQTRYKPNYQSARIDSLSLQDFATLIKISNADTIVVGHSFDLSPAYFEVAKLYYPQVVFHQQLLFNETYVLSRKSKVNLLKDITTILFKDEYWGNSPQEIIQKANVPLRFIAQTTCADSTVDLIVKVTDEQGVTLAESASCYWNKNTHLRLSVLEVRGAMYERKLSVQAFVHNPAKIAAHASLIKLETIFGNALLYGTVQKVPN